MPDDILEPIAADQIPTHRKPRWHQVVISNPEDLAGKSLIAQGQTVPMRLVDGQAVRVPGDPVRTLGLDLDIQFDPGNEDHLQLMVVLDRIVKAAHAARLPTPSLDHA